MDPFEGYGPEEQELLQAILAFFGGASAAPAPKLTAAILTGAPDPVINAQAWQIAGTKLTAELTKVDIATLTAGMLDGLAAIPARVPGKAQLAERIAELASNRAGLNAVALAQAIDQTTRDGLRVLIGNAARDYARDQSLATLRTLQARIRASIGLTTKQAARIERWRQAAEAAGLPEKAIANGIAARTAEAIELRARAIAERGVIESIGFSRHKVWEEAIADGTLPENLMKVWRNQGDSHVRPTHRAQARVGPIPFDQIYALHGVQHPPSPDFGCRCWEEIIIPPTEEDAAPTTTAVAPAAAEDALPLTTVGPGTPAEQANQIAAELAKIDAERVASTRQMQAELDHLRVTLDELHSDLQRQIDNAMMMRDEQRIPLILANDSEMLAAWNRMQELLRDRELIAKTAKARAHALMRVDGGRFAPLVEYGSKFDKQTRQRITEAMDWLRSVLGGEPPPGPGNSVAFVAQRGGRANQAGRAIYMSKQNDVATLIHEMGHWLEQDHRTLQRSVEFLQSRTSGEAAKKLQDLLHRGYRADEIAKADKFFSAYVGKIYRPSYGHFGPTFQNHFATEILSMGLEEMYRDPLALLRADEEMFLFVLRYMRGERL